MQYISRYDSPIGKIFLTANNKGLTGLWFDSEKYYCGNVDKEHIAVETDVIKQTKRWLDIYFQGKEPDFTPLLNPIGSEFRLKVWDILKKIPYGETITYNDIAKEIAKQKGIKKCRHKLLEVQ